MQCEIKMKNFNKYFFISYFKQTWLVHISFVLILLYLFLSNDSNKSAAMRILEGIMSSCAAAYIFYILLNVVPSYFQQKSALLTIETELRDIVINISAILSILQTFSKADYKDFSLPNEIIYFKKNSNSKTFFNPRTELENNIKRLNGALASIKIKYCVLPIDIIVTLNKIEDIDLRQKLNSLYSCIDNKYAAHIYGFPECLHTLEEASKAVQIFSTNHNKIEKYQVMNENEKKQYALERQKALSSIKRELQECNGRIYKGLIRIK